MKIASLAPANTEILYELGVGESVIATSSLCDHPPEATGVRSMGGWSQGTDLERIRELEPDIVFTSDDLQKDVAERIDFAEVVHVSPKTMEDVYRSFLTIGEAVGRKEKAEKMVEELEKDLNSIKVSSGVRVYCEEWSDPPMISGNWIPGLLKEAGLKYPIEEGIRSHEIETGKIEDFDPEYIFLNICGAGEGGDPSQVLEREGWSEIQAVSRENVHAIDDSLLNRPGPRLAEGLKQIVSWIE